MQAIPNIIFDNTVFSGVPHPLPGTRKIGAVPWSHLFPPDAVIKDRAVLLRMPPESLIRAVARQNVGRLTYIDLEHWPVKRVWGDPEAWPTHEVVEHNREMMGDIIDIMHDEEPGLRVGYYAYPYIEPPQKLSYRYEIRMNNMAGFKRSRRPDGRWGKEGVADKVDCIFPVAYLRDYPTVDEWIERTMLIISEARNFGKQVYVFFNHRHSWAQGAVAAFKENPTDTDQYVPIDYWASMVRLLMTDTDNGGPDGGIWWSYHAAAAQTPQEYIDVVSEVVSRAHAQYNEGS